MTEDTQRRATDGHTLSRDHEHVVTLIQGELRRGLRDVHESVDELKRTTEVRFGNLETRLDGMNSTLSENKVTATNALREISELKGREAGKDYDGRINALGKRIDALAKAVAELTGSAVDHAVKKTASALTMRLTAEHVKYLLIAGLLAAGGWAASHGFRIGEVKEVLP